jgi:hypothetical protein
MFNTIKNLYRFVKNIYNFRKEIYYFRPFDYSYNLQIFQRSLILTKDFIKDDGSEIEESRNKKVDKMNRTIELLDSAIHDNYMEQAEDILGIDFVYSDKENSNRILKLSEEIQNKSWNELWGIIKGSGNLHDGTDIRCWWD